MQGRKPSQVTVFVAMGRCRISAAEPDNRAGQAARLSDLDCVTSN
jgi:hypothetical protein